MPDLVEVRVQAHAPAEDDRVEIELVDVLSDEHGPLDLRESDFYADLLPGVLHHGADGAPDLVAVVRHQVEGQGLAVLHQDPVFFPEPRLMKQALRPFGVVGQGFDFFVVMRALLDERAGDVLRFAVQHVAVNLLGVHRHSQGLAHARVLKRPAPVVVADVGETEAEAREHLEPRVFLEPLDLVGARSVAVHGARVERDLLCEGVGAGFCRHIRGIRAAPPSSPRSARAG